MTRGDGIEHKRRSRKLSLAFGFALFLYGVSLPVAGALGRGVEPWMVPMTLLMSGSAIYMILQALDRSLAAIVVGLGWPQWRFCSTLVAPPSGWPPNPHVFQTWHSTWPCFCYPGRYWRASCHTYAAGTGRRRARPRSRTNGRLSPRG